MDGFMNESLHEQKLINQSCDVYSDLMPLGSSQCPFLGIFVQKLFIIKIIISPHKTSFNMFWRFLLILPYKSQIFLDIFDPTLWVLQAAPDF